jgi:hypothetical protein
MIHLLILTFLTTSLHAFPISQPSKSSSLTTSSLHVPSIELIETTANANVKFPLDPSDDDFMCRGKATQSGYAQPCDMYVAIPVSESLRQDTDGFSFLHSPGYIVRLIIIGLPGLVLSCIMMYWSVQCCCYRRANNSTERCAQKCLFSLAAWEYRADDKDLMPLRSIDDLDYPRKGITNSPCFTCWAPVILTISSFTILVWMSTAAFSGIEATGTGFCSLDAAVRNYADTLESTRDAYSLVDPNIPPIQLGDVNQTNGPTPPELLDELSIALRKGIVNIEGWCPSHGNDVPMESSAYDDASPTNDKRNDKKPLGTSSGIYGSKLAHEPMVKFLISMVIMFTLFPIATIGIGYCNKSRVSFRAAMRSGTLSLCLLSILMSTVLIIGTIESDVCPTITNRIEHDLLKEHSNQDPFILHQMSLMVRCNTNTMSDMTMNLNNNTIVDPNDSLWQSELKRIQTMVARTKEEQKARAETPSSDETSQEKSESADAVNVRVRHQEALVKWLEATVNCNEFSASYNNFLISVCGTGFGWFEQCAVACMLITLIMSIGMCCISSSEYLIEQEERRGDPEGMPAQTHSSLLGGDQNKRHWPSV